MARPRALRPPASLPRYGTPFVLADHRRPPWKDARNAGCAGVCAPRGHRSCRRVRPRTSRVKRRPRVACSSNRGSRTAILRCWERAGESLCRVRCTLPQLERKIARVSSGSGAGVSRERRRPKRLRRPRPAHMSLREGSTERSPSTVTGVLHSFALGNGCPSLSRGFPVLGQ